MFFLLKTTVYLSVTALFILLTKKIFKNRLSAKWHLLIWGLLLVRFIIPSLPESNFSVFNGIDKISIQPEQSTYYTQETVQDTAPEYSYSSPSVTDENTEQHNSSSEKTVSSEFIVLTVYISGFVILLTYFISVYCVCIYKTSRLTPTKNIDTLKILDECRKLLKIKRKITVVDSDESPMLVGIIKPKILLPDIYSQREKRDIIIHELCHYKNMDILIIWMSVVVLSLNWFNPIMWISFFTIRRDIEIYCDKRVLSYSEDKREYAKLLLKTALHKNQFILGTTSLQNGEKEVTRRIKYIAKFKKTTVLWTAIGIVTALIISVVCLTNGITDYSISSNKLDEIMMLTPGSNMAEIAYADEVRAIVYYHDSIFVYDIQNNKISESFDISKLNCSTFRDGDSLVLTVSDDGAEGLLSNVGQNFPEEYSNYIVNFDNGDVKKTKLTSLENPYTGLVDSTTVTTELGWSSVQSATVGTKYFYLVLPETRKNPCLKYVRLVESDSVSFENKHYYVFNNGESPYSPLYDRISEHLEREFKRVYTPYYEIVSLSVSNYEEKDNEAIFTYTMIHKNYYKDPDTVEYIQKAKINGSVYYEQLKEEYLAPKKGNYRFKAVLTPDGEIELYYDVGPHSEEWERVEIDDFILGND